MREKCKMLTAKVPRDAFILAVLVLASSFSFGLGYLAGLDTNLSGQGSGITIIDEESSPSAHSSQTGKVVASKTGTKYYLPECAGADRILDANKIWFASASLALTAGYTPAANCKGL